MKDIRLLLIGIQGYDRQELFDLPLGHMYIAAYLIKHMPECKVQIVTSTVHFENSDELMEIVKKFNPTVVGFRGLSLYVSELLHCAQRIQENLDCFLIAGGPVAHSDTQSLMDSGLFHKIVLGDGEEELYKILQGFRQGEPPGSDVVVKGYIEDLNTLPHPDYGAIDLHQYAKFVGGNFKRNVHGSIFSSRGCPYQCIFCHNIFGKKPRLLTAQNVIEEILKLNRDYGIVDFCIMDDIFNFDYDRSVEIFKGIIDSKISINLFYPNGIRGDTVDENFIDYMVASGTKVLTFAVEAAAPRIQKLIKKNLDVAAVRKNIVYSSQKGILTHAFFMIGFPSETEAEALMTLNFIRDLPELDMPILNFVRYYKGTNLYDMAVNEYGFTDEHLGNVEGHYENPDATSTPTISNDVVKRISEYFTYNITSASSRIDTIIQKLRTYCSDEDALVYLNHFYPYQSSSIDEFIKITRFINRKYKGNAMDSYILAGSYQTAAMP